MMINDFGKKAADNNMLVVVELSSSLRLEKIFTI